MNRSLVIVGSLLVLGGVSVAACGGSEVPVLQNTTSDLHAIDAGTGKCGATSCASGELCCAGSDAFCSPTCMNVKVCPAFGHACAADAGPPTDAGGGDFKWYATCGFPVCPTADGGGPSPPQTDAGTPCAPQGTSCATKGETCGDPAKNCGSVMVCDDHDPKGGVGGCPISTKKAKQDIAYVSDAELARLHDETIQMKLATYRYKGPFVDPSDPNATHLGFIVEDQPRSLSVDRGHDRVDLYGYVSMAVATMQVQEKQIAALRKQVDALEATCPKKATAPR